MVKLTHGSRAKRSLLTLTALASTLMAAGCQFEVHEDEPPVAPDGPNPDGPVPDEPDEDPACSPGTVVQQAFVCAGYVSEQRNVSQRLVRLEPAAGSYACYTSGTGLTPFVEGDDPDGPYPGTGGSTGEGGGSTGMAGASILPYPEDGGDYEGDGDIGGSAAGGGSAAAPIPYPTGGQAAGGTTGDGDGDGDWGMGGEGEGGYEATGGAWGTGGGSWGTGGGFPEYPNENNWCSDAAQDGTAISGVTYSVDACGQTDVRLPIRIQEPTSWYRIRVFHGESPCERGDVIADISGQGTGEILDLPVDPPSEGYITIEYTADSGDYYYYEDYGYGGYPYPGYYGGGVLEVELNPISGGLIDGE